MTVELRNESFNRGLAVLEQLARDGDCSLAELHKGTGIPKSSLRRLLGTLITPLVGDPYFDHGLNAIACPIKSGPKLAGAISLVWPSRYLDEENFAAQYLDALQTTCWKVSEAVTACLSRRASPARSRSN